LPVEIDQRNERDGDMQDGGGHAHEPIERFFGRSIQNAIGIERRQAGVLAGITRKDIFCYQHAPDTEDETWPAIPPLRVAGMAMTIPVQNCCSVNAL
jgi:hypothetical protein